MKRSTFVLLKILVWLVCLWPVSWLLWGAVTNHLGADPTATITFTTGLETLWLLTISLAVSPVRRLSPRLNWLIRFRRLLGLFAFFYGTLHLLTYIALYAGFDVNAMVADITKRKFITMGVTAWLLMLPLAATSTNWAIRKLGGKRWNRGCRLRGDSLLVAGEARCTHSDDCNNCARRIASCTSRAQLDAAPQNTPSLRLKSR